MKAKLKLFEVLNLEAELNGLVNPETGERLIEGLLQQKISHNLKYKLRENAKILIEEKKSILQVQNDLISKYGTTDDKGIGLDRWIADEQGNRIVNPQFEKYSEEWNKFLISNEKEIELTDLLIDDFKEVYTKDNYTVIDMYFLIKDE